MTHQNTILCGEVLNHHKSRGIEFVCFFFCCGGRNQFIFYNLSTILRGRVCHKIGIVKWVEKSHFNLTKINVFHTNQD